MANEFSINGIGAITPDLILKSLIGCVVATGAKALRIQKFAETTLTPVHCGNYEDFQINLARALMLGYDDVVVLRVNITDYFEGQGTFGACDCGMGETTSDMLNSLFGEDALGKVYLNLANITT